MSKVAWGTLTMVALSVGVMLTWVDGAAAATPISSCQTLSAPGTYQLTTNLEIPSGNHCLEVAADFVTIDLNGFFIGAVCCIVGVVDASGLHKETIVRNGVIFCLNPGCEGINLQGPGTVVDNVTFFGHSLGAVVVGANATVKNSTLQNNQAAIIFVGGGGTASNNVIVNNQGQGIDATGQAHMKVVGNTIARTATGIVSRGIAVGNASTVKDNVLLGLGQAGENVITAGSHSVVNGNTVIDSAGDRGIQVGDHSTVKYNVVNINSATGAQGMAVAANSQVIGNTALGHPGVAIDVVCPSTVKFNTAFLNGTNLNESGAGCTNVGNNAP